MLPVISLDVNPDQGGVVTAGERFTLSGSVTGAGEVLDFYVLVNDQKVHLQTAAAGNGKDPVKLKFAADLPLELGDNSVTAVAWEGRELASRRELVIHRRPAPRPPVRAE